MAPLCRHRFPPEISQHAIWLYLRFTLSYRDVEELLAERGLDISYETVRRWMLKFGPTIARRLRQRRARPSDRWHLDEMVIRPPASTPAKFLASRLSGQSVFTAFRVPMLRVNSLCYGSGTGGSQTPRRREMDSN